MQQNYTKDGNWCPPASKIIMDFFIKNPDNWYARPEIQQKVKVGMRMVNEVLLELYRQEELKRKACPCGKGWIYKYN